MIRKKLYMIMMLIFLSVSFTKANTAPPPFTGTVSLGSAIASPGEDVVIPLNVTGFTGIGSFTFYIRHNPNLIYAQTTNKQNSTITVDAYDDSTVAISFFNDPSVSFTDGLLLNLNFHFLGMTSSQLSFASSVSYPSEVSQGLTVVYPTYNSGSVTIKTDNTHTATIPPTTVSTGEFFTIPVNFAGFTNNVGAVTQKIKYDTTKLSFVNIIASGNLATANASSGNGIVSVAWFNTSGANINSDATTKLFLRFQYTGNIATTLEFYSGSLIVDNTTPDAVNIPVSYFNGTVSPGPTDATATLGSVTGLHQNDDFDIPLTFTNMPYGPLNGLGAVTLNIPYDNTKLLYIGDINANIQSTGSALNISYYNVNGSNINLSTLNLRFKYIGIGSTSVSFAPSCSFTTLDDRFVQVAYTNSTITPSSSSHIARIASVYGAQGSEVLVPVTFTDLPTNMGAVTLHLQYDASQLTYVNSQDLQLPSITVGTTSPNIISITWLSGTGVDINGEFLKLKFIKNSPASDPPALIEFISSIPTQNYTQLALADANTTIVHTSFVNGDVHGNRTLNLTNVMLEGLYNPSNPSTMKQAQNENTDQWAAGIADHITVELHDATNYTNIIYSDPAVELSTAGTATVIIPGIYNGSYYITVKHRNSLETTTSLSVLFTASLITQSFGAPLNIYDGNLKLIGGHYLIYGGDVNQDGIVDGSDMSIVQNDVNLASSGYLSDDCNGDGLIDGSDMSLVQNNANLAIGVATP